MTGEVTFGEMKSVIARDKSDDAASTPSIKLGLAVRPLNEVKRPAQKGTMAGSSKSSRRILRLKPAFKAAT